MGAKNDYIAGLSGEAQAEAQKLAAQGASLSEIQAATGGLPGAGGKTGGGGGSSGGTTYTVQPGDSYFSIAGDELGNQRFAEQLAAANGGDLSGLQPGDVIIIPNIDTSVNPTVSFDFMVQSAIQENRLSGDKSTFSTDAMQEIANQIASSRIPEQSKLNLYDGLQLAGFTGEAVATTPLDGELTGNEFVGPTNIAPPRGGVQDLSGETLPPVTPEALGGLSAPFLPTAPGAVATAITAPAAAAGDAKGITFPAVPLFGDPQESERGLVPKGQEGTTQTDFGDEQFTLPAEEAARVAQAEEAKKLAEKSLLDAQNQSQIAFNLFSQDRTPQTIKLMRDAELALATAESNMDAAVAAFESATGSSPTLPPLPPTTQDAPAEGAIDAQQQAAVVAAEVLADGMGITPEEAAEKLESGEIGLTADMDADDWAVVAANPDRFTIANGFVFINEVAAETTTPGLPTGGQFQWNNFLDPRTAGVYIFPSGTYSGGRRNRGRRGGGGWRGRQDAGGNRYRVRIGY